MPDETAGNAIPTQPAQKILASETINPPAPPNNPTAQAAQPVSDQENEREIQNLKDEVRTAEKYMIWLTGAIAFFALCTIVVGLLQWNVMTGQLGEMKSSSGQTDRLIDKTRILAENAGKQADRTKDLADRMKDQADRTKTIAEQAVIQANAASSTAKTSRDALTSTQRAFLNFTQALETDTLLDAADQQRIAFWEFRSKLENSGTTPTRQAIHTIDWLSIPNPLPENFDFADRITGLRTPYSIGPRTSVSGAAIQVPVGVVNLVRQHVVHLYFWGWTTYRDIFSFTPLHVAMFCSELAEVRGPDPAVAATSNQVAFLWNACNRHNCADEECEGQPYGFPSAPWHQPAN